MTAARRFVEIGLTCLACALIAAALLANQSWFDRHFLPSFWTPREDIVEREQIARIVVAVLGIIIAGVRKPVARFYGKEPLHLITTPLAIVLAIGSAELLLRRFPAPHVDVRANWFATAPLRHERSAGEDVSYALDRNGYRVASPATTVDFDAPTIVFAGESIMTGLRLPWSDTVAAQTSKILGLQSANIAVPGFTTNEMYHRVRTELPRFRRPVAVVALFAPSLFDRNLDNERPQWRLASIARRATGYRTDSEIDRGVEVTREALQALVAFVRSRGAVPLIVVPEFDEEEEPGERVLRNRILDEAHLPYVLVRVDPNDRVDNDGHPDGDGARTIAEAIATALKRSVQ